MIKRDKLHYSGQFMNSFDATFNYVLSARESGKTTCWVNNAFKRWKKEKCTTIVLRYLIADITDTYISDLETAINDFLPDDNQIKFRFKKGSIKDGVVDCFIDSEVECDIPIFRFIAISNPISRIKSMKLKNAGQIVFDEVCLHTRGGEKYPNALVIRFKEIYNTYLRCCKTGKKFKVYCFGNPYSRFHPLLSNWNVPFGHLNEGDYYYNKKTDVFVEFYKLKQELKDFIIKRNPLYKFDDSYTNFALEANAINDTNFEIFEKQPENYSLRWIFRLQNKYLLIYRCNGERITEGFDTGRYWIECRENYSSSRGIYSVDLDNLIAGTALITTDIKAIFWRLKNSIANRDITYKDIETGYLVEALYPQL